MVIVAGAFIVYRPPRRSLVSVTTQLSYLSRSFCRALRTSPEANSSLEPTSRDAQQRPRAGGRRPNASEGLSSACFARSARKGLERDVGTDGQRVGSACLG